MFGTSKRVSDMHKLAGEQATVLTLDIQQSPDIVFCVDRHHRITAWNRAAEKFLGLPSDQVLGRPCTSVLAEAHLEPCASCAARLASHLQAVQEPGGVSQAARAHPASHEVASRGASGAGMAVFVAHTVTGETALMHVVHDIAANEAPPLSRLDVPCPGAQPPSVAQTPSSVHLTPAEHHVLDLLASGFSTREIALALSISNATTRNHIAHILMKLGAGTRLEAVVLAARLGLTSH